MKRLMPFICRLPSHLLRVACLVAVLCLAAQAAEAQRRITPVSPDQPDNKVKTRDKAKPLPSDAPTELISRLAERMDQNGAVVLVDTLSGTEYIDTTLTRLPPYVYPRLYAVTVGVDLWDGVAYLFGQRYGGSAVQAELSLHNRFKPTIGFGMGAAKIHPDGATYTYYTSTSPYFLAGIKYNMLYNSDAAYQLTVGAMYGLSTFKYRTDGAVIPPGYWNTPEVLNIPERNATVGFVSFSLGVRVNLAGNLSAGWDFKLNVKAHNSTLPYGNPLYVPGYGKWNGSAAGAFSIYYTIPLNSPSSEALNDWKEKKSRYDKRKKAAENRRREYNQRGY